MSRLRPSCRECWDPAAREGEQLCVWCSMSPAERRRAARLQSLIAVAVLGAMLLAALLG